MRGRKPTTKTADDMRGNPGRRAKHEARSSPSPGPVPPPDYLTGDALSEWQRVAPGLVAAGLLTAPDVPALAAYCQCYGQWIESQRVLVRDGTYIINRHGDTVLHPAAREAERLLKQIRPLAQEFGLTPFSRSRLNIVPPSSEEDEFKEFLEG